MSLFAAAAVCVVYCLWSNPNLLPMMTTWPAVLSKLIGGAGECVM